MNPDDISAIYATSTSIRRPDDLFSAQEIHTLIQGKMIVVTEIHDDFQFSAIPKDEIKRQIALKLAYEMMEKGSIEFTQERDPLHMKVMVRARCFVVPNDQVQILREKGY